MAENSLVPLLHKEGFQLLESLGTLGPYTSTLADKLSAGLRKRGVAPALVAAILTQLELREAARAKFGDFARGMLFTRDGLEQATRLPVAAVHAGRFRDAGCHQIADLGCGLGTESLALAGLGMLVMAFELDEATAAAALLNLRAYPEARVTQADILELDWGQLRAEGVDGAFADPARRDASGRRLQPESWKPPLSRILTWQDEIPHGNLGIKIAPGINYQVLPAQSETQWISVGGELVEAGIWLGDLIRQRGRSALLMDNNGKIVVTLHDETAAPCNTPARLSETIATEDELGKWIFEPDDAIIRAGLLAQTAEQTYTKTVSEKIAYLTRDSDPKVTDTKLGSWFETLEVIPLDEKKIRAVLKTRPIRSLEIKKRGADVSPAQLRRKVLTKTMKDGEDLTLIVTRLGRRHRAILCRRHTEI
ncbi:THUMP-like domain-containing protein [Mobiluncus curtisii]|jgi:hypothetical protein|uniref:THUMP-like domain-containing protein n=1 Tax=Mobiluncus curtisii TaxID=2051 RepID=UPI00242D1368|nr:DNA cytosine methyltransferase [Mobiluncus curtisii]